MSRKFSFIDHTADIAVDLQGETLEELFTAAAESWKETVSDSKTEAADFMDIELTAQSKEELLVTFLNEINFLLLVKKWLCCGVESIKIIDDIDAWELSAELTGSKLSNDIELKQEIKSITYHQIDIVQKENEFTTRVVFDI